MIKLSKLVKIYDRGRKNERVVLDHIDLQIEKGELISIVGKSGSGKSTLLQILAGMLDFDEGEYVFGKQKIKTLSDGDLAKFRNEKIGIVLQDFALIEEFSALENVLLPLEFAGSRPRKKMEKLGHRLLGYVGMEESAGRAVKTMSGGEKQRVAIARALANNPDVLLADEPTGALDSESADLVMSLFHRVHRSGKTVVIVTHDDDVANQCPRRLRMADGKLTSN